MQRKPFIAAIAFAILVSVRPLIAQDVPGMQFQKEEIPTGKNVLAVGAHQNRIVTVLEDGEVIQNDLGKTAKVGEIAGRPVSVAASDQTDQGVQLDCQRE